MKKINLKNILKKTFKQKKMKKRKKIKKLKKIKKIKKVKKKVIKVKKKTKILKKKSKTKLLEKNKTTESSVVKQDVNRPVKGADQKPEIKKIKVQGTEKKEYKIKDYVVYPKLTK